MKKFLFALGLAGASVIGAYHYAPEKALVIPASVSRQVEHLAPLASKPAAQKSVPKAVVKTPKKSQPLQKTKGAVRKTVSDGRDFATDLRKLQNCSVLNKLKGTEPKNAHEQKLKSALIPWYLRNCIFT